MEEWEKIVDNNEINCDSKSLIATLRSAKNALDGDLAPFESEWLFSTLLLKPVHLLELVADNRMCDEYTKCIVDALKLLGDAVNKYDNIDKYYEDIVQLCLLPYPAMARQHALGCLARVARRAVCGARDYRKHVEALQHGVCLAPLAVLIGTICECHPHVVAEDVTNIWRVFLNMLDSKKYSGTVTKAVLQGILGLFRNFGDELPTMELLRFYDQLVAHLEMDSCQKVCLEIITHHAGLFFTRVTHDARMRGLLWKLRAEDALRAVYTVCQEESFHGALREVRAHASSPDRRVRFTALRILGEEAPRQDIQELNHQLRSGNVDHELCEAISRSIRTNIPSSHHLLQPVILFYDSFPTNARTDILQAILNSHSDVVNMAISFIISELRRNQKLTIWADILKCEKLDAVYDNVHRYINYVVEGVAGGYGGVPLSSLVPLLLSLPPRPLPLRRLPLPSAAASSATALLAAFSGRMQDASIGRCDEDAVKLKCSLVVLELMDEHAYPQSEMLAALRTIFSAKNIEAAILSKAVTALEVLVRNHCVEGSILNEFIHYLERIDRHIDKSKKDGRILHRDIFMFIGKHRRTEDDNDELNFLISQLKETLTVRMPYEGGEVKINLSCMLYSALLAEDEDALNILLPVVCDKLPSRCEALRRVLVRVCVCLSRGCGAQPALAEAAGCTDELMQCILEEKSSESRKILLDGLEMLLDRHTDDDTLESVVDKFIYIENQNEQTYIQVLDKIVDLIEDENSICMKFLPDIVLRAINIQTDELLMEKLYRLFVDKIYMYDDIVLNKMILDIIKIINKEKCYARIDKTLYFVKNVLDKTDRNLNVYIHMVICLRVFVAMKGCFDFDETVTARVMERARTLFQESPTDLESVLEFLSVYSDVLLVEEYERTIQFLTNIIENIRPRELIENGKHFVRCVTSLKNHLKVTPGEIRATLESRIEKIKIRELKERVVRDGISEESEIAIRSVKVLVEACDGQILIGIDGFIVSWKDMLNDLYHSGYLEMCLEKKYEVLSDLTYVALRIMEEEEMKAILTGGAGFGTTFAAALIPIFYPHLTASLLLDSALLLYDVVRHAGRVGRRGEVDELVDEVWPSYVELSTFRQKQQFLVEYLPGLVTEDSRVYQWLFSVLKSDSDLEDKLMLIDALPEGDMYGPLLLPLFPLLPSRLSELRGSLSNSFRAILDALATNGHTAVLSAVATMAATDPTPGWWDFALDACMRALARAEDARVLSHVHDACARAGHGAFVRLMMPLLRHSKSSAVERFVAPLLPALLGALRQRPRAPAPRALERCLLEQLQALSVLEVVFQKVPKEHIESPRSHLYSALSVDTLYYLVTTVCKLCVTLRGQYVPHGIETTYRLFQYSNYLCLSSALLCREPRAAVYRSVFDVRVWSELVSEEEVPLPLKPQWEQGVTRHATSVPFIPSVPSVPLSRTRTSTQRSRVFLKTLSENPLMYDLVEDEEEPVTTEVHLPDSPLNRHPCMPVLMALLARLGGGEGDGEGWRAPVVEALTGARPVARLIAQAVCNSREALTSHAGSLTPGLLTLISDGRMDQMHVDVLETIIHWKAEITETENLNKAVESLIATIVNRQTDSVQRMLLDKLMKILDIYGNVVTVPWSCFEEHFKDPSSSSFSTCLRILTRSSIYIPELLPAVRPLVGRSPAPALALYGRALRTERERGGEVGGELKRCRGVLDRLRRSEPAGFIKTLYYIQKEFPDVCDLQLFRSIADLIPKIPHRERSQCLSILTSYIKSGGRGDVSSLETIALEEMMDTAQGLELACVSLHLMSPSLRERVLGAAGARGTDAGDRGHELFVRDYELHKTQSQPSIKRGPPSLRVPPTAVQVSRGVLGGRGAVRGLSQEPGIRLLECFILSVVIPLRHQLPIRLSAVLELFFQDMRQHDIFKKAKLSDEASVLRPASSSTSTVTANQHNTTLNPEVDQLRVDDVLKGVLQFAQKDDQFCTSVIIQLIQQFGALRPGFDFRDAMSANIMSCIKMGPVAPSVLEIVRHIDMWKDIDSDIITDLVNSSHLSEGEAVTGLMLEEWELRRRNHFTMGIIINDEDQEMARVSEKFSVHDLISSFGKLSNWDNLTRRKRTHISTKLPALWTDESTYKLCIDDYDFTDAPLWTRCLVSTYRNEDIHTYKLLRDLDKWPRRLFDIAAVLESQQWDVTSEIQTYIHDSDCLAQWTFRIMMRSLYSGNGSYLLSRSQASWAARGNEMGLYEQVVRCCRNVAASEESELVKVKYQEMVALRAMALERNDCEGLRNLLHQADSFTLLEEKHSFGDMLGMNELTLRLRRDLNSLDRVHVDSVIGYVKRNVTNVKRDVNRDAVQSVCVLGLTHLDKLCEDSTDAQEQSALFVSMCELMVHSTPQPDLILNRLDSFRGEKFEEDVAERILNTLRPLLSSLRQFSIQQLLSHAGLFPCELVELVEGGCAGARARLCLSLLTEPALLLRRLLTLMLDALHQDEGVKYREVYDSMRYRIFDNPYIGPGYRVLSKYLGRLEGIVDFANTDKQTIKQTLTAILSELHSNRDTLSLSDVCPALLKERESDSLNKLLGLQNGVRFVKFEDKLCVYTDAVSRPVLLSYRCSDGRTRRCIVKAEGPAHAAAAALRGGLARLWGPGGAYEVTSLTPDCLLIEYLENNTRIRDMVASVCQIDGLPVPRTADADLILSPSQALQQFEALTKSVPATALRSAIEAGCVTLQEFIKKRRRFTESVCDMTIFSFLCGLSDRHLQNIVYDAVQGSACAVDCGALRHAELPPARLTRNILAACHTDSLEGRLQTKLMMLREHQGLIIPSINIAFKHTDKEHRDKLPTIRAKVRGTVLAHHVTRECIQNSGVKYKEKYIELMDEIFGTEVKSSYSVEEEVSSLLLQSTDPRILSVTRSGWEPWI